MDKILTNAKVFKRFRHYNDEKHCLSDSVKVICADVYKININGHLRLICAYKNKSCWIAMDVLTGIILQREFDTKTNALEGILEYFEEFLNPELYHIMVIRIEILNQNEKELFKVLDEDQKICYNNLVDLCVN